MESHEVTGTVKEFEGKAEKAYGRAKDKITDAAHEWKNQSEDAPAERESEFIALVREYPGATVGVALLVGFLTGSLLASRS